MNRAPAALREGSRSRRVDLTRLRERAQTAQPSDLVWIGDPGADPGVARNRDRPPRAQLRVGRSQRLDWTAARSCRATPRGGSPRATARRNQARPTPRVPYRGESTLSNTVAERRHGAGSSSGPDAFRAPFHARSFERRVPNHRFRRGARGARVTGPLGSASRHRHTPKTRTGHASGMIGVARECRPSRTVG